MLRRGLRENNGATTTAVSMATISSTLVLVVATATTLISLEAKIMAVSLAWGGLHLLQRVLVGKRRRTRHWLVQYGAMAAYYLPTPLAFYAAKSVYTASSHIDESTPMLVLGVGFMFYLSVPGAAREDVLLVTNMRVYSLRDRPQDRFVYLMCLVFLGWVDWKCVWIIRGCNNCGLPWWWRLLKRLPFMGQYFFVALIILFLSKSDSTLDCQTKAVAHYMKKWRESSKSSLTSPFFDDDGDDDDDDNYDSNSSLQLLDCCRYPFAQGKDGEWVTVKDLVQRDDLSNEDQDIWLSYSLCRLLARRYYGFQCAEEGDDKVRRFALADLGTTTNDGGYKRAFTIVEVQLAFLHDYFFTASLPIIESGFTYIQRAEHLMWEFLTIVLTFMDAIQERSTTVELGIIYLLVITVAAGMFMSSGKLLLGRLVFPVQDLSANYWRTIHTALHKLNYLPNDGPAPAMGLVRLFRHAGVQSQSNSGGVYWRNKLGQYSILQDYDRRPSRKKALVAWFQEAVLFQPSYNFIKHLPVEEEEEVDMLELDSVRELVADTLRAIDGPPTNGTRSLKINMMDKVINRNGGAGYDEWLWTCRQETHTDTILIWHIATCYCDMTPMSDDDPLVKWHHEAARALSRYCAYLVAFLPEFLPEHSLTTKQVFQRVLQEAKDSLGTTPMEENEKHTKMQELLLPHQHEQQTTFHKGIKLGRQLEMLNDDRVRWKVIAEFWAETILYIAPSDNVEAHIEHLAKGGEFVTHLWAMLSNAGILKRATGEWDMPTASTTTTEGPQTHQLTEALSSSIDDEASTSSMSSPPIIETSEPPTNEKGKQHQIMENCDQ